MLSEMPKSERSSAAAARRAKVLVEILRASNNNAEASAHITISDDDYRAVEAELERKLRKRAA
jgi:hypothetical protein